MNGYKNYHRLFVISMIVYTVVLILLALVLFKPEATPEIVQHPLIGQTVIVEHGYSVGNSYYSSSPTGKVVSITDGWITISIAGSYNLVTIPTSRVHEIRAQD